MGSSGVRYFKPVLIKWMVFVVGGVVAYGMGLMSGHQFHQRQTVISSINSLNLSSHSAPGIPQAPVK